MCSSDLDTAGNSTTVTDTEGYQVDTVAPDAPTIDSVTEDTGASSTDFVTNDLTPLVSGTAEAGSTVELFVNGTSAGTTTADATTGEWSVQLTCLLLRTRRSTKSTHYELRWPC